MPFFGKHSCFSFTPVSVRQNAPSAPGVYGLSNAREWVFIGSAENVRAALFDCLSGPALRSHGVTGFTFELCNPEARDERERRLILEMRPVFTTRPA